MGGTSWGGASGRVKFPRPIADSSRHYRPGQRSAPGLIDTDDKSLSLEPERQFFFKCRRMHEPIIAHSFPLDFYMILEYNVRL